MNGSEVEYCLKEFAKGLRPRASLEDCLLGSVRLRFWDTNERSSELLARLPKVRFTRDYVDAQLQRFLAGDIGARDLSDWAATIRLLGCYEVDEDDLGSSEVWDIMDELMSPDVWGPLNVDSVIDLRRRLSAPT